MTTETTKAPAEAVDFELTTDDLNKLERDMQTLPADQVKLPDGRLLSDVLAQRDAAQREEGVRASADALKAMQANTSATVPQKHKVTITPSGDIISSPIADPVEEKPAPATSTTAPATPLPADFPSRGDLVEGGLTTLELVRAATDDQLLALPHISDAALSRIRTAQAIEISLTR